MMLPVMFVTIFQRTSSFLLERMTSKSKVFTKVPASRLLIDRYETSYCLHQSTLLVDLKRKIKKSLKCYKSIVVHGPMQ